MLDDWLLRTLHRLVERLARAVKMAREGRAEDAKGELDALYASELGMPRRMLERLDAATCVMTLGQEKARLLVLILEAEAEVARASGDEALATARAGRAAAITSCLPPRAKTPEE